MKLEIIDTSLSLCYDKKIDSLKPLESMIRKLEVENTLEKLMYEYRRCKVLRGLNLSGKGDRVIISCRSTYIV